MGGNITQFPKQPRADDLPRPIVRPCDASLALTWMHLETQLGTVEGYNRLVELAAKIRVRIYQGDITAQSPIYVKNIEG